MDESSLFLVRCCQMSHPAHAVVLPNDVIPPTQVWLIFVYRECVANDVRGHQVHFVLVPPISLLLRNIFLSGGRPLVPHELLPLELGLIKNIIRNTLLGLHNLESFSDNGHSSLVRMFLLFTILIGVAGVKNRSSFVPTLIAITY